MSSFTDFAEEAILNHLFKGVSWTPPAALYLALFTADPGESSTPTDECTYLGYERAEVPSWGDVEAAASGEGKQIANAVAVLCPGNAGADDVVVTHAGLFDAMTGGELLLKGALGAPKTLRTDDGLAFQPGQLVFSVD